MDIGINLDQLPVSLACPVEGCGKTFTRADHVRRHVSSSHQKALPFQCSVCKKRFGRRDLLKRHALKHEELNADESAKSTEHKPRVRQACMTCATKKLKCDGEWPCTRCRQKGMQCNYPHRDSSSTDALAVPQQAITSGADGLSPSSSYTVTPSGSSSADVSTPLMPRQSLHHTSHTPNHTISNLSLYQPLVQNADGAYIGDVLDFGHVYSLDFNESDLSIFDNLNSERPFNDHGPVATLQAPQPKQTNGMFLMGGFEAFSRSLWFHNPHHRRGPAPAWDERDNLRVSIDNAGAGTTIKLGNESIDQLTRDKFLIAVTETFRMGNYHTGHTSFFPSEKILNDLLQFSLADQYLAIDSWIHSHFFQSKEGRIPLLAALVSNGAVHSALPAVQKFGYAFQEAIRLKCGNVFEEDSRATRDMGTWQALNLLLQIGLWSGIARKIELSEAFLFPVVTMLRRGGCMQADYVPIHVAPTLAGQDLHARWYDFLTQESRKRIILHAFSHDAQTSISLQVSSALSPAEMTVIPLPAPCEIWQAESAEEWKKAMLNSCYNSPTPLPSVAQCLDDVSYLINVQTRVDFPLSALVLLYGYWHLIRQLQELQILHYTSESTALSSSNAYLASRQRELELVLKRFGDDIIPLVEYVPRQQIIIIHHVMTMYLHIRMSELQLFAGKQGEQASRDAFYRLKKWIECSDSRVSIRLAASVLRSAAQLRHGSLRDFFAVAVYHASLTLWSYGTISRARRNAAGAAPLTGSRVVLDESPSDLVGSFVSTGHGIPCISILNADGSAASGLTAELENPPAVMKACLKVLEGNYENLTEGLHMPLLVENLAKLMRDLGEHAFISVN